MKPERSKGSQQERSRHASTPATTSPRSQKRRGHNCPRRGPRKITPEELRRLRNDVPVALVFDEVLRLHSRWRGWGRQFRCPVCYGMHVAVHERTNIARCFRCERNYNPIDLLMLVPGYSFLDAVRQLRLLAEREAAASTNRGKSTRAQVSKMNTIW